jgi:hypothetical protein
MNVRAYLPGSNLISEKLPTRNLAGEC